MTEEQFAKATKINQKISEFVDAKNEINNRKNCRLAYIYEDATGYRQCASWKITVIKNILNKHDKMINEEIDEEIRKLLEEVKTL